MPIEDSPYPRVAEAGHRIVVLKEVINGNAVDASAVDTALKALQDGGGRQVMPDGHATSEDDLQRIFEAQPQFMETALTLYENLWRQAQPLGGGPPAA